ncbi:MAG: hypothetical protein B6U72_00805 [Candidatus Altiarchaeales archaeon ex4484_2]|nr:MAG: hypothetical protein B6U72_00805 [Candidatus Altiarchaeales archaeon ex4484_2]
MKTKTLLLLVLLTGLLFTGCVERPSETTTSSTATTTSKTISSVPDDEGNGGSLICKTINESSTRHDCYRYFAVKEKNPSICDEEGQDTWCYRLVFMVKDDLSLSDCDKIQDQKLKYVCYESIAVLELSDCDKIQDQKLIDDCYERVAILKKDFSICDKIQDQGLIDNCYYHAARYSKNKSFCDKIQNEFNRYDCSLFSQITCSLSCSSTDHGDIHKKGSISYQDGSGCPTTTMARTLYDFCASDSVLVEYDCGKDQTYTKEYVI